MAAGALTDVTCARAVAVIAVLWCISGARGGAQPMCTGRACTCGARRECLCVAVTRAPLSMIGMLAWGVAGEALLWLLRGDM